MTLPARHGRPDQLLLPPLLERSDDRCWEDQQHSRKRSRDGSYRGWPAIAGTAALSPAASHSISTISLPRSYQPHSPSSPQYPPIPSALRTPTGIGDGPPIPRSSRSPPGRAAANPPPLPPLAAGASASARAPAGPPAASTSIPTGPPPSHPILPPISNLENPHRPSLPPPPPAQQHHQQPSLPPPPPPPPAHLTRPPPPYDANPYPRAQSSSPSAHISSGHGMASHAPPPPPPQQHGHPQGPPPPGPPPPGMMPPHPQYHYGPPGPPMPGHPPPHIPPGMDPNAYHRMPLPASMGVMPTHRPNKKEIKRRTKTGCLTCRKRRIKCDEGHPTCRNCEKSKRVCQGYDPIFKTQAQPSTIQAAPNVPATARPPPATQTGYPPTSQPYMAPPANQPYAPMQPGAPGQMQSQQYGIDPSLEQSAPSITAYPTTVGELLDIGERPPPPLLETTEPLSPEKLAKAKDIYNVVYGAGLDKFFDTTWFAAQSWQHIAANAMLVAKVSLLESRFHVTAERDAEANKANQSLEGHLLWEVMQLCRDVSTNIQKTQSLAQDSAADVRAGVHDAAKRIQVFEALITNRHLAATDSIPKPPTTPKVSGPQLPLQLEDRKLNFWHALSKFTTIHVPEVPAAPSSEPPLEPSETHKALQEVETYLTEIRQVLDAFENRDILYSVAIVRHYLRPGADRVPPPSSNDEQDRGAKLSIARNFLSHEKHSGTFQVAKVIAGMVVRSWKPREGGA